MLRKLVALSVAGLVAATAAQPASAQFFFKPPPLPTDVVTGEEPGIVGPLLPGATPDELKAALVWNLRAALNVAALQCQFEPTLLTVENYNAVIKDHAKELATSYTTLGKYFTRINKTPKAGQSELDRFGTRVYSGFSTISAQYTFCSAAGRIGRIALFTPPGHLATVAQEHMRELRASLVPAGEQIFPWGAWFGGPDSIPPFERVNCWTKYGTYDNGNRKCEPWSPPASSLGAVAPVAAAATGSAIASR